MKRLHDLSWIGAAVLAASLAAGCERSNTPPNETAGQKLDRTTPSAERKMDQAAADMKQKAGEAKDKVADATITAKVKNALMGEPELKALQIDVDVRLRLRRQLLLGDAAPRREQIPVQVPQGMRSGEAADDVVEYQVVDTGAAHVARAVGVQDGAVHLIDDGDGQP